MNTNADDVTNDGEAKLIASAPEMRERLSKIYALVVPMKAHSDPILVAKWLIDEIAELSK